MNGPPAVVSSEPHSPQLVPGSCGLAGEEGSGAAGLGRNFLDPPCEDVPPHFGYNVSVFLGGYVVPALLAENVGLYAEGHCWRRTAIM